jgi:hypothetical protein
MLRRALLSLLAARAAALVVPMKAANPTKSLTGQWLERANGAGSIDVGEILQTTQSKTLVVLGTHAADFNACEYMQKVRFYLPRLAEAGVDRYLFVVNGDARQASKLAELLDLPDEVELLADPTGAAGRRFGCDRGFRPDDAELNPYVKLTVVGLGFGPPWQTLPPVLAGYFGSPNGKRDWIEAAMRQNELAGRTPAALTLGADGAILGNKFDDLPLDWGVRPFELATLRLQKPQRRPARALRRAQAGRRPVPDAARRLRRRRAGRRAALFLGRPGPLRRARLRGAPRGSRRAAGSKRVENELANAPLRALGARAARIRGSRRAACRGPRAPRARASARASPGLRASDWASAASAG